MPIVCRCPGVCEIHPKYDEGTVGAATPATATDITLEDKLTLKELEAAALNAKLAISNVQQQAQAAGQILSNFAEELYKKHGLKPEEYGLDLRGMKFVKR
jgi:hypothetical protein